MVKAPGNLVISAYVTCPDITLTVTPDLKLPGSGKLLWVDLGQGRRRLGGSALAHAYSQASTSQGMVPLLRALSLYSSHLAVQRLCLITALHLIGPTSTFMQEYLRLVLHTCALLSDTCKSVMHTKSAERSHGLGDYWSACAV